MCVCAADDECSEDGKLFFVFFPPCNSFNVSCLTVEVLISNLLSRLSSQLLLRHSSIFRIA